MKTITILFTSLFIYGLFTLAYGEDIFLTLEDGVSVILRSNHTWDYDGDNTHSIGLGTPILLDDGTTLIVKKNGTWGFVKDASGNKKIGVNSNLESVSSVGMAQREDLGEAKAEAMKTALERLAKQFNNAMPNIKVDNQTLLDCIQAEEKEIETKESKQKIWKATVKLYMDGTGVQNVLYCVKKVKNLGVEEEME